MDMHIQSERNFSFTRILSLNKKKNDAPYKFVQWLSFHIILRLQSLMQLESDTNNET